MLQTFSPPEWTMKESIEGTGDPVQSGEYRSIDSPLSSFLSHKYRTKIGRFENPQANLTPAGTSFPARAFAETKIPILKSTPF